MFEVRNSSIDLEPRVGDLPARLTSDHAPGLGLLGEQLGDRQVERPGDALEGRDRRAGDVALDLRQEALGDPGPFRDVAERQASRLADRADARPELRAPSPSVAPCRRASVAEV